MLFSGQPRALTVGALRKRLSRQGRADWLSAICSRLRTERIKAPATERPVTNPIHQKIQAPDPQRYSAAQRGRPGLSPVWRVGERLSMGRIVEAIPLIRPQCGRDRRS